MNKHKGSSGKKPTRNVQISRGKTTSLDCLISKRGGGAQNLKGLRFQLMYACYLVVTKLLEKGGKVRLEGLEDIDYLGEINEKELIQLKTSKNKIDASAIREMGVLHNFLEVFLVDRSAKFKLAHNSSLADGKLLSSATKKFTPEVVGFWKEKFSVSNLTETDIIEFFNSITFEKVDEKKLHENLSRALIAKFEINTGAEIPYLNALFSNVFQWSAERQTISASTIQDLMQSVKESFSKLPTNPAIENSWIASVAFEKNDNLDFSDYFDGKAAQPYHIANNIPVRRPTWEKEIEASLKEFDVNIIRASSGQGKSTLAWLVAKTFLDKGYSVFKLEQCSSLDHVAHLSDFLEAIIKIGQLPLLVIDGLSHNVRTWGNLVEKSQHHPVKFIISSREDEWVKHSYDLSKIQHKFIDIKLSIGEAQNIYNELSKKQKLHPSIKSWQPSWEKIQNKGLLIEYVYLLTQGQMIESRLQDQIKKLNAPGERDSAAKTEILRLISLADVMNIKLQISKITEHINSTTRFETDRNEVYHQLEKEYYVKLNRQFVEGLHPIRSAHMVRILHSSISVSDSLATLLTLIDRTYIYEFFLSIPELLANEEKNYTYEKLAGHLAGRNFSDIVFAIDGLMRMETVKYWRQNKNTFDEAEKTGSLELFVYDSLPCTELNMISSLSENFGEKNNKLKLLSEKLEQLNKFNLETSDVLLLTHQLQTKLNGRQVSSDHEGLVFLIKWFTFVGLTFPRILEIDDNQLLDSLRTKDLNQSAELFNYVRLTDSERYKIFFEKNKIEILYYIKKRTGSICLDEVGNTISCKYLLEDSYERVNALSTGRIDDIYEFLPHYDTYCTEAIVLPYPEVQGWEFVVQNSIINIPVKNITDTFDIHVNQIWSEAIFNMYRAESVYAWQKQYTELRTKGTEFAKSCTRVFEARLEANQQNLISVYGQFEKQVEELFTLVETRRRFVSYTNKYYDKERFSSEQKKINEWCSSLLNFMNQIGGVINPKTNNDRNLASINLKAVVFKLPGMQESFNSIASSTHRYFSCTDLEANETLWYTRLMKTVLYFLHMVEKTTKVSNAKSSVEEWYQKDKNQKETNFRQIFTSLQARSHLKFHFPTHFAEDETIKAAVIGVEGINMTDPELKDIPFLLDNLVDLGKTDLSFFSFVYLLENAAIGGFRVSRSYFLDLEERLKSGRERHFSVKELTPINVDKTFVEPLPNTTVKEVHMKPEFERLVDCMRVVWKLSECRAHLNKNNNFDLKWLEQIENELTPKIKKLLPAIEACFSEEKEFKQFRDLIIGFTEEKSTLSPEEILTILRQNMNGSVFILEN